MTWSTSTFVGSPKSFKGGMYIWFLTTKRLVSRTSGIVNSLLTEANFQYSLQYTSLGIYIWIRYIWIRLGDGKKGATFKKLYRERWGMIKYIVPKPKFEKYCLSGWTITKNNGYYFYSSNTSKLIVCFRQTMHGLRKIKLDFFYRNYLLSLLSFIYRGKLIVSGQVVLFINRL